MANLGNLFKEKREALGLTLNDVSEEIKIGINFLQAIEKEEFHKLPRGIYGKFFVKKYAEYLELDTSEIMKKFMEEGYFSPKENENITLREKDKFITATERAYNIKLILFLVVLFLILSAILYYLFIRRGMEERPDVNYSVSPKIESQLDTEGVLKNSGKEVKEKLSEVKNLNEGVDVGKGESENEIKLLAKGRCWIKVKVDGGEEKEYLLNNDEVLIKYFKDVKLTLGSAGSVDMYINGKKCKPLGDVGEVKDIEINVENQSDFLEAENVNGN